MAPRSRLETANSEVPAPDPAVAGAPPSSLISTAWLRARPLIADHRFTLVMVVAMGLVVAGQLAEDAGQVFEDLAQRRRLQLLEPPISFRRWAVILVVLYELAVTHLVDRTVQRSLGSLQRALLVDQETFRSFVDRMRTPGLRLELALLAVSALVVTVLFLGIGLVLPVEDDPLTGRGLRLPGGVLGLLVLAGYTVLGWAGLRLFVVVVRLARVLTAMSRQPLDVNVFDTTNLLPFGNLALTVALAPAGIIVILLLGLGLPQGPLGISVLLLASSASVLALLLPIRGIHREMSEAKELVLGRLSARLREVHDEFTEYRVAPGDAVATLNNRANTLIPLRKSVQEMTTWPFRDTLAFGRAVLIASAPIIYAALSELIKVLWFR